jgi:hypothetical protein
MAYFPAMPVEDEDRLHDPRILKDFLSRAAGYRNSRSRA